MSLDAGTLDHGSVDSAFVVIKPRHDVQDTLTIVESIKKLLTKKVSDSVTTTDTVTTARNLKLESEADTFTDSIKKLFTKKVTDTSSFTDSVPQYYYLGDTTAIGSLHSLSILTSKRTGTRILAGHKIIGTSISSVSVRLKRVGLTTGLGYLRIRDDNDNIIAETSIDSSLISPNETVYLFSFSKVTIQANYRISMEYENGSLVNFLQVFGGTSNIPAFTEVFEFTNAYVEGQAYAMYGIFAP